MRSLLCILLLCALTQSGISQNLVVFPEHKGNTLILWAQNRLPCALTLYGRSASLDTTFQAFIPKGARRKLINWNNPPASFASHLQNGLDYTFILGDPNAVHDDTYRYSLPFPRGKSYRLTQGNNTSFTHNDRISKYAFDFSMPIGSSVTAARGGSVGYVVERFSKGGEDSTYFDKSNRIMLCHDDGTVAVYAHLKHKGSLVNVGDEVFAGQPIGLSGNTGFTTSPHLHFTVLIAGRSIPIQFRNQKEHLTEGKKYQRE